MFPSKNLLVGEEVVPTRCRPQSLKYWIALPYNQIFQAVFTLQPEGQGFEPLNFSEL